MANRMTPEYEERTRALSSVPEGFSLDREGLTGEGDHSVLLCTRLKPNVLFIKSGLLFIDENKGQITPETLSVTCRTKIIFIPERSRKENDMKRSFLLFLTVLSLATSVLGCNMMRGAGEDIENAGGSIQRTVEHND